MPDNDTPVCVTGSAGFVGQHLCAKLTAAGRAMIGLDRLDAPAGAAYRPVRADIQHLDQIRQVGAEWAGRPMIHLAAEAEVVTPWELVPTIFSTNLVGSWNLLTTFQPQLIVFASSSAVYGTASVEEALPQLSAVRPLGLYGASKSMGELLLRDWSEETGSAAVALRLGNVIGCGCRGLIPYLVRHAKRYPQAEVRAELRGHGRLVRDYTPVEFVARIFAAALDLPWKPGSLSIFNVGTGRGLTNRDVAQTAQRILNQEGYQLECNWGNPVPAGEALEVVPNSESLAEHFGVALPTAEEVESSIEASVLSHLRS